MDREEKNKVLLISGDTLLLEKVRLIVEERPQTTAYTTRSWFEAVNILSTKQIDAVLLVSGFGHIIEMMRKFTTVPCTYIACGNCLEPSGTDFIIEIDSFTMEDIPKYINLMIMENKKRSRFKGLIWFRRLKVDMDNYTVFYKNEQIKLKPLEIKLFFYLLKFLNRVVSRERLFSNVWEYEQGGNTRTLDVHIMALRAMLQKYDLPLKIETLRGEGYKLIDKEVSQSLECYNNI
jgi:DNA-binding response OmpR family regulator